MAIHYVPPVKDDIPTSSGVVLISTTAVRTMAAVHPPTQQWLVMRPRLLPLFPPPGPLSLSRSTGADVEHLVPMNL